MCLRNKQKLRKTKTIHTFYQSISSPKIYIWIIYQLHFNWNRKESHQMESFYVVANKVDGDLFQLIKWLKLIKINDCLFFFFFILNGLGINLGIWLNELWSEIIACDRVGSTIEQFMEVHWVFHWKKTYINVRNIKEFVKKQFHSINSWIHDQK